MPGDRRLAMMRSLARSMLLHEGIRTTETRAKELRGFVERLVTISKNDDLHHRRLALSKLPDKLIVEKLFEVYGPRYADRPRRVHAHHQNGPAQG